MSEASFTGLSKPPRMSAGCDALEARRNILWEHTSPAGAKLPPLSNSARTDVAVIGGGIAGLSTTLHLAKAGVAVTLLEAAQFAGGASGRSGGLVAPDMIHHTPSGVEQKIGAERGSRLVHMIGSSARFCFELINEYGLDCQGNQGGFWTPAHNLQVGELLQKRGVEWRARGFNVRYAGRNETTERLGVNRYVGALEFADGGALNPLAFSRGLAATALKYGAEIYCETPVTGLLRTGSSWRVKIPQGQLEAKRIVLAANGGNADLHSKLKNTSLPLDVIEYATVPLTADVQSRILKENVSFTDKQPYLFTARFDVEHRLIAAFPDFAIRRSAAALTAEAGARIKQHFPLLQGTEIQYLWPGRAWINTDLLPKIYEVDQDVLAIQACNGRGIGVNATLGAELAEALVRNDLSGLSVQPERPNPIQAYPLARYVPLLLTSFARLRNRANWLARH